MGSRPTRETLRTQLALVLRMAGANPFRWIVGTVAVSVILAGLDTLGVAAMVPLMQLTTGAPTDSGSLKIVANMLGTNSVQTLLPVVAGFVAGVFIIKSLGVIAFRWWLLGRTTQVSALSSVELMRRYVLAPYPEHRSRRLSELYRNINESTTQAASVLLAVVSMFSDAVVLVAIVGVLAIASPVVTLFAVVLFGFFVFGIQRILRPRQRRIGQELADSGLQAWQFLMPSLEGFREVRLTSSTGMFVDGFRHARLRSARASRQMGIVSDAPRYLLEVGFVLAILGIALILFTTGTRQEALTVLGIFAAASVRARPTMNRISANLATMRIGQAGLHIMSDAVDQLDDAPTYAEAPSGTQEYSGDVMLRQVVFQYPDGDKPVLNGVSLVIKQNQTTAFVGSSGAGKSTLLDLVLGLLEPTAGEITCGGTPIGQDSAMWYRGLGVVPQDVFLTHDTIMANIAFGVGAADIDRRRVIEVAEMAQLHDLVAELPDGVETVVGERGVRLSGGQRQRLGLARALYRRPRILVLDEATSALDNLTEHEISETLARLQGSMTILIVAHRLSTVRHADTLVFLKNGQIDAQGTFADVRDRSDDFAHLVELGRLE
jgi:ABC-type bacteriocin/lantibiotic exporter with double-glycine peptidase domain